MNAISSERVGSAKTTVFAMLFVVWGFVCQQEVRQILVELGMLCSLGWLWQISPMALDAGMAALWACACVAIKARARERKDEKVLCKVHPRVLFSLLPLKS